MNDDLAAPEPLASTGRLTLLPFTHALVMLAMHDRLQLAAVLDLAVPEDWPGPDLEEILPFLDDALTAKPERAQWMAIVAHTADRVLIGSAGFIDTPDSTGSVEMGYHLVQAYRGHGYITEAATALRALAFSRGVQRICAECSRDNAPSVRVLQRLAMHCTGRDANLLQWELLKPEG